MSVVFTRSLGLALVAGLLTACSSGGPKEGINFGKLLATTAQGLIASRGGEKPEKIVVTAQLLAETEVAALQIDPEVVGGSDFLRRIAIRNDSGSGRVEVWNSTDNVQIFLRDGVVVATRSLGRDIIAADAQMTVKGLKSRSGGSGLRTYTISNGDVTTTEYSFRCELRPVGNENITLAERPVSTLHFSETCIGGPKGDQQVRNEYWIEGRSGLVRKSRQWMGPRTGYFDFLLLKN